MMRGSIWGALVGEGGMMSKGEEWHSISGVALTPGGSPLTARGEEDTPQLAEVKTDGLLQYNRTAPTCSTTNASSCSKTNACVIRQCTIQCLACMVVAPGSYCRVAVNQLYLDLSMAFWGRVLEATARLGPRLRNLEMFDLIAKPHST